MVPPPFECTGDVVAGLDSLDRSLREARDLRGLFVMAYVATTHTITQWIERGLFLDNEAMARYVVAFANAYRGALANSVAGQDAQVHISHGFESARRNSWLLVQQLARADTEAARAEGERLIEQRAALAGQKILSNAQHLSLPMRIRWPQAGLWQAAN